MLLIYPLTFFFLSFSILPVKNGRGTNWQRFENLLPKIGDFAIRKYNQITPSGHSVQNFFYKHYTWIYSLIKNLECKKEIIWLVTYDGNEAWKIFSGPILLIYENLVLQLFLSLDSAAAGWLKLSRKSYNKQIPPAARTGVCDFI